ncbi:MULTISPECIES: aminoglycoside phosphotransferase family protein [Bacillus]|uniref:Phosphotransferase family enzyme n=1 Tax=Bacillus mycoides TaxID=1405 RepID=A0A3D9VCW6_BACMY|nr:MULTISPECIES: aminoglycoside phosphotransferase family protein [Bacillus]RBP24974.1 phosphotransferase family enzyme [Bacillus sp. DB-2]REF38553.1 phosphotransferase family enzyme [Bacillus mycoides]
MIDDLKKLLNGMVDEPIESIQLAKGSYSNQAFKIQLKNKILYLWLNKYHISHKKKRQIFMLEILGENGLIVPKILQHGNFQYNNQSTEFILTEGMKGSNLGIYLENNVENLPRIFFKMGKTLKKIHSIRTNEKIGYINASTVFNWKDFLRIRIDKWICEIKKQRICINGMSNYLVVLRKYFHYLIDEMRESNNLALLHGDFYPNNIVVDFASEERIGILDFEWSLIGDPIYDFRVLEMFIFPQFKYKEIFYRGYGINPEIFQKNMLIYLQIYKLELAYLLILSTPNRISESIEFIQELYNTAIKFISKEDGEVWSISNLLNL